MPKPGEGRQAACDVGGHGCGRELRRRLRVLARQIAGGGDLHQHQRHQADGEGAQGPSDHVGVAGHRFAVQEDGRHHRQSEQRESSRRGHAEQHAGAHPPVQRRVVLVAASSAVQPREVRQQHRAQGHGDDADGQFHQPVRVVEPRRTALFQKRGEHRADEDVDLPGGSGEDRRHQQAADLSRTRMGPVRTTQREQADARQGRHLEEQLRRTGSQHAPGQRIAHGRRARSGSGRAKQSRGDQRHVQQHRREGRDGVAIGCVQHGTRKGR